MFEGLSKYQFVDGVIIKKCKNELYDKVNHDVPTIDSDSDSVKVDKIHF